MSANINNSKTTCPWGHIAKPPMESMNFAAIVKNQKLEKELNEEAEREKRKHKEKQEIEEALQRSLEDSLKLDDESKCNLDMDEFDANLPLEVLDFLKNEEDELKEAEAAALKGCESDAVIAQMLQAQFDKEYNEDLKRIEKAQNKLSKVTVCLDKYRKTYIKDVSEEVEENKVEEDDNVRDKRDWDRFDTNERLLDAIPKCGYTFDKGEMITKHDDDLCGVRNACRMMSFPLEFATGDGAGFEMKLSNKVFNQLKTHSQKSLKKTPRSDTRKDNTATTEMGVDGRTRLILYKFISNQMLEQFNGIISTGKEAVILHASSSSNFVGDDSKLPKIMPKECAVKIFKTTLNDFKQRHRYIKDDYRFKNRFNVRFSKHNNSIIINMWAEKEMYNLMRLHNAGIRCPEVVTLKNHVLVMSFIGENNIAAPKLKDAILTPAELVGAYDEVVDAMHKLYNEAKLVHADLSEYNILWHEGNCWFIDVSQSVEPQHPSALEFLMRDCNNIVTFFSKKGVPGCHTKEKLFEHVTSMNAETLNVAMLERIHTKGPNKELATAPNQNECPVELKPLEYPFDFAWEKTIANKCKSEEQTGIDTGVNVMNVINVESFMQSSSDQILDESLNLQKSNHIVSVTATD